MLPRWESRRLKLYANQKGAQIPEDIEFAQVLHALFMGNSQRHLAEAHFGANRLAGNLINSQAVTIRFSGSYVPTSSDTNAFSIDLSGEEEGDPGGCRRRYRNVYED